MSAQIWKRCISCCHKARSQTKLQNGVVIKSRTCPVVLSKSYLRSLKRKTAGFVPRMENMGALHAVTFLIWRCILLEGLSSLQTGLLDRHPRIGRIKRRNSFTIKHMNIAILQLARMWKKCKPQKCRAFSQLLALVPLWFWRKRCRRPNVGLFLSYSLNVLIAVVSDIAVCYSMPCKGTTCSQSIARQQKQDIVLHETCWPIVSKMFAFLLLFLSFSSCSWVDCLLRSHFPAFPTIVLFFCTTSGKCPLSSCVLFYF